MTILEDVNEYVLDERLVSIFSLSPILFIISTRYL